MKKTLALAAALSGLMAVAACQSPADDAAEKQADALEEQAGNTSNEAAETALNEKADRIEQEGGNADGGLTTGNTPTTTPDGKTPMTQPAG